MPRLAPATRLLLLLTLSSPAFPAHPKVHKHEEKREVLQAELQWRTAALNGDVSAMEKLLSDDFVGISWTGQVNTKATQLDRLRTRTLVVNHLELFDQKIKIAGPVAIVTSRGEMDGANNGDPVKGSFLYTRVYQRVAPGTWKMTNFEATRIPQHRLDADQHP